MGRSGHDAHSAPSLSYQGPEVGHRTYDLAGDSSADHRRVGIDQASHREPAGHEAVVAAEGPS